MRFSSLWTHLFFALLLVALTYPLQGQSHFFLPFGDRKGDVKTYLESRDYLASLSEDASLNVIHITTKDRKQVEYAFHGRRLYAITVLNNYRSPKEAQMAQHHVLEYLKGSGAPEITRKGKEPFVCYTALTDLRVLKVFVRQHEDSQSIILTSISRKYGPPMSEEDIYYEKRFLDMDDQFVLQGRDGKKH